MSFSRHFRRPFWIFRTKTQARYFLTLEMSSVTLKTYKKTYYTHILPSLYLTIVFPLILAAILNFSQFSRKLASLDTVNKRIRTQRPKIYKIKLFTDRSKRWTTKVKDRNSGSLPTISNCAVRRIRMA